MLKEQKPIAKKYVNLKAGTIVVLGTNGNNGMRLYKDGVLSLSSEDVEKNKAELDRLQQEGFIKEVGMEAKSKPVEIPRTPDVLDQDDDLDPELFVRQKQPDIFNPNPPKRQIVKEADVKKEDDSIPDRVIDTEVKSLPDKEKSVEDGFEGTKRTVSCVANVRDWRKAKKMIEEEINDLNELDIIIDNDHRNTVVEAAKIKKEAVQAK